MAITSIESGAPGSRVPIAASGYSLNAETGVIDLFSGFYPGFRYPDRWYGGDPRVGEVTIAYSAGYPTAYVPQDLKRCAIVRCKIGFQQVDAGVYSSRSVGSTKYTIAAATSADGTLVAVEAIEKLWRRKRFS